MAALSLVVFVQWMSCSTLACANIQLFRSVGDAMTNIAVWLSATLCAGSLALAQETPRERVLLPLAAFDVPGAFGSRWSTELWIRNDTDRPILVVPLNITDYSPPPHRDVLLPLQMPRDAAGEFLYVDRVDGLYLNLRVRDTTRADDTFGTELPIVREKDMLTKHAVLLPVPIDPNFRATLRIYDASFIGVVKARVRIFAIETATLLAEKEVQLETRQDLPFNPGYVQLTVESLVPASYSGEVRVELDPLTPAMKYWSFVTVTDNKTQHVTTITPQ